MKSTLQSLLCLLFALAFSAANAAGILTDEEAAEATPEALMEEVAVFKNIRQAMTLSLSRCESEAKCDSAATTEEVQQMINAIDARVDGLGARQEAAGNSAGLTDVIVAYADERGGLNRVMKKVDSMISPVVENIDESELFGDDGDDSAPAEDSGGEAGEFSDLFADEDEEL